MPLQGKQYSYIFIMFSEIYTKEEVLKKRKIYLFLVLFPVGYLNIILIPEINKVLKDPLELGEFIRWVGC